ncbi:hypothetical protein QSJ19_05610 [Gordonia sp. ABSL11-1]|uniref:hypothetical protein n=1 Tax=Gordonia sp. ABSL11-1 TaxID=3053924 RepID=UPI00257298A0|nr:hypothetical protein [Gordonia sp. ABSL11-1]MDL9945073.1 hypothetical protein [Gordonia sp. ABSL11-1]
MNTSTIGHRTVLALLTGVAGVGVAAAAIVGAGSAHAGTMPMGTPSIAMTITNHSGTDEFMLNDLTSSSGSWMNAPQPFLAPGASETVVAIGTTPGQLSAAVQYRMGDSGPDVRYVVNDFAGVNAFQWVWGPQASQYPISHTIDSGNPYINTTFDQW